MWKDPLKAEPQEVFRGPNTDPNTDPHKVFGRLGLGKASKKISAEKTIQSPLFSVQKSEQQLELSKCQIFAISVLNQNFTHPKTNKSPQKQPFSMGKYSLLTIIFQGTC